MYGQQRDRMLERNSHVRGALVTLFDKEQAFDF
jgi:hypothetical protein